MKALTNWDANIIFDRIACDENNTENQICVIRLHDLLCNMDLQLLAMTKEILTFGEIVQKYDLDEMRRLGYLGISANRTPLAKRVKSDGGNESVEPQFRPKSAVREKFEKAKMKAWRIIIRNLPFKTTQEDMQNVCSKFGSFVEIVLPPSKKNPKTCGGFGFVQFVKKEDAEKAREFFNENKFLGRMVAADWALDKDTYETNAHEEKESLKKAVKVEKEEKTNTVKKFSEESDEEDETPEDEQDMEDESESEEESEDEDDKDAKKKKKSQKETKNDQAVIDGKVVFLRNLSFETTAEMLKEELGRFGKIDLALICKYKDSGHPKGTAFVHFETPLAASNCIEAVEDGIIIDNRLIKASLAIPKTEAVAMEKEKLTKVPKDKRNLRLVRFSLIRDGTAAANGMSKEDAAKREKLAEAMKKKLENTNMFVSPVRLCIHNLPQRIDDRKLKHLVQKSTSSDAQITECRVWMDKKRLTTDGKPKSSGFGFVAFKEHQHALECLKKLNNNPDIFGKERRPIVEFSIENLMAIQAKARRNIKQSEEKMSERQLNEKIRQQVKSSIGEVHTAGMKFLPKFLGKKVRHRDLKGMAKKNVEAKNRAKAIKFNKISDVNPKNLKKKSKQNVTKYLSLST
ncbi:unnamed protein product [Caenorhabditis bovis]|uniref:RRM domain-containing protein n=1 Tax=Caenorhabditis bovis TaxID=2654633 RepID=A0A8S1FBK7_9PELO|nr:unnamed protein product [Caenorhabditis bovis]